MENENEFNKYDSKTAIITFTEKNADLLDDIIDTQSKVNIIIDDLSDITNKFQNIKKILTNEKYKRLKIELMFHGTKERYLSTSNAVMLKNTLKYIFSLVNKNKMTSIYISNTSCFASTKLLINNNETIDIEDEISSFLSKMRKMEILYSKNYDDTKPSFNYKIPKNTSLKERERLFFGLKKLIDCLAKYEPIDNFGATVFALNEIISGDQSQFNYILAMRFINKKLDDYYSKIENNEPISQDLQKIINEDMPQTQKKMFDILNDKELVDIIRTYGKEIISSLDKAINTNKENISKKHYLLKYFIIEQKEKKSFKPINALKNNENDFYTHEEEKKIKNKLFYNTSKLSDNNKNI